MSDAFKMTVVVEVAPEQVWKALTERTVEGEQGDGEQGDGERHYVLPGFPSFQPLPMPGASCTTLEVEPGRLLRVRKDHQPCRGTEIAIQLEQAATGTRITVVQSGFDPAFLEMVGRNIVFGHGGQIVADLALYVERGVVAPGRVWGVALGAVTADRTYGLEVTTVQPGGFAQKAGLKPGDVIVSFRDARIYDTAMLSAALAVTEAGSEHEVAYIRGREVQVGTASF